MKNQQPAIWYVRTPAGVHGPFTTEQLKQHGEQGFVFDDFEIRRGVDGDWVLAENVRGLKVREQVTAPQPPQIPMARMRPPVMRRRQNSQVVKLGLVVGIPAVLLAFGVLMMLIVSSKSRSSTAKDIGTYISPRSGQPLVSYGVPPLKPMSTREIVQANERSVFLLRGAASSGTGFLINPRMIATNSHVIAPEAVNPATGEFVNLRAYSPAAEAGRRGPFRLVLLAEDTEYDMAFLELRERVEFPPARIAGGYTFQRGQEITIIGNPAVFGNEILTTAVTKGVLSTVHPLNGVEHYQMGAAVNPGNSGGPVFDEFGQVIGVVRAKSHNEEQVSFCIPIDSALRGLDLADERFMLREVWAAHNAFLTGTLAQQVLPRGASVRLVDPILGKVLIASSPADFVAATETIFSGDDWAFVQLIDSGRCTLVPSGTRAQVIDHIDLIYHIRIINGPYAGRTGLVPIHNLQ